MKGIIITVLLACVVKNNKRNDINFKMLFKCLSASLDNSLLLTVFFVCVCSDSSQVKRKLK